MKQNATYKWTEAKEKAAHAVAEGILTESQIAEQAGVNRTQVFRWKQEPAFAERVRATVEALAEASRKRAIGRREDRMDAYQQRWDWLKQIREERAADPRMADIPGGKTGLIVIEESEGVAIKDPMNPDAPEKAVAVPTEVAVDTAYLKALTDLEKQAAIESGEWTEKREVTGANGKDLIPQPITLEQFKSLTSEEKIQYMRGQLGFADVQKKAKA